MRAKTFIIASLILMTSVNICALSYNISIADGVDNEKTPQDKLAEKSYYQDVFNRKERRELKKADKYIALAKKEANVYRGNLSKIERFEKMIEKSRSERNKKKFSRKASKLRKKVFKSIDHYNKAIQIKTRIYDLAIDRLRLKDSSEYALRGKNCENKAKSMLNEAGNIQDSASKKDVRDDKIKDILTAKETELKAIAYKSLAISNYKNDDSVKDMCDGESDADNSHIIIVKNPTTPYKPNKDHNLYRTRADSILPRLNMSQADWALIQQSGQEQQKADKLFNEIDNEYVIIDSLRIAANNPKNEFEREQMTDNATMREMRVFAKLIRMAKLYVSVNEKRYKVYDKYLKQQQKLKSKAKKAAKAKEYKQSADRCYNAARNRTDLANKISLQHSKYLKLMEADELLLKATEYQEEAFAIYFDMPYNDTLSFVPKDTIQKKQTSNKKWIFKSRNVYSTQMPKVAKYRAKKGIVFAVQIGLFKGLLNARKFGRVQPVIFDKFADRQYKRFMVGEYRTTEAAELALRMIKKQSYRNAKIVALRNGVRTSYSRAKLKLNKQTARYKSWKEAESYILTGKRPSPTHINSGVVSYNTGDVAKTVGLRYFVQLGMFSKPISVKKLYPGLEPILYEKIPGKGKRYLFGNIGSYKIAKQETQRLKRLGYKSPYPAAYNDGRRIDLDEAQRIEKEQYGGMKKPYEPKNTKKTTYSKVKFAVQVGSYTRKMSNAEFNKLKRSFGSRAITRKVMGNKNIYYIGNYENYEKANYLKNKLKNEGHGGIFVIAFRGNKKIPLNQVLKK